VLREIKEFDPKNDAKDRNELLDRLDESFTNFLVHIRPIISFYSNSDKADDSSRILEEAKSILEYMKSSSVEMTKEKSSAIENAKKMLNELKDISAESGITKYSSVFADEARENKSIATKWLIGASILGVISIVVAYFVLQLRPTDSIPTTFEIVQYTLTKVIIFTILSYLLVLFVKNYNANRHNYIVNKHRQNALLTFSTFVNSAKDVDTKNAVLLQATQSIFTNQVSGYLKNECDSENPNKFIEIIKNVSSTKS